MLKLKNINKFTKSISNRLKKSKFISKLRIKLILISLKPKRIETLTKEYKALEDEFRMALIIEANRFTDIHSHYERTNNEVIELRKKLQTSMDREERSRTIIGELNSVGEKNKFYIE